MHQLIIIIPSTVNMVIFDEGWPDFLAAVEQLPGLIQESLVRINQSLFGTADIQRIYSFGFEDQEVLNKALLSPSGERAGSILHQISRGEASIFTGSYRSDTLENIQSFSS
jgi:hypothetical protein